MFKQILQRIGILFVGMFLIVMFSTDATLVKSNEKLVKNAHMDSHRSPVIVSGMLDRFEDEKYAIILIESLNEQIVLPADQLPPISTENTWFVMKVYRSSFYILSIDTARTMAEKAKADQLNDRLKSRIQH